VELALLKSGCTPAQLLDAANKLLNGVALQTESSSRLAVKSFKEKWLHF